MVADSIRQLWDSAQGTWPQVSWSLSAFTDHLARGDWPTHPDDLYVAGAAGHRITPAWASIDETYRDMVIRRLHKGAKADFEAEDLWSEALARMMRDDSDSGVTSDGEPVMHITRYRGLTRLPWHFLAAARTIAIDRHRRTSRGPVHVSTDAAAEVARGEQPIDIAGAQELAQTLQAAVVEAFGQLEARHQFLLASIYRDGLAKADAGAVVGLSPWQTSRELRKAEEVLRLQVQHAIPGQWGPQTRAAWTQGWQSCWTRLATDAESREEGAA